MTLSTTTVITRGSTVNFSTTFFDVDGNITQPGSATINIAFPNPGTGTYTTVPVAMTAPTPPATAWTAQWDSRGAGVGAVEWSVHSDPGPPFGVEDGYFQLKGNQANQVTFT